MQDALEFCFGFAPSLNMARWVFTFREVGSRELTAGEQKLLRQKADRAATAKFAWGVVAVLLGLSGLGGIVLAAGDQPWGWAVLALGVIGMFWALSYASKGDRCGLLLRRAIRLGKATRFERSDASLRQREVFERPQVRDEAEEPLPGTWWDADERFEESLVKELGRAAQWIELVADDNVLLFVEDRLVNDVYDLEVFSSE